MATLTVPAIVRADKRAAKEFRVIKKYLEEFGEVEGVDAAAVGVYCVAVSDYERLTAFLREKGETRVDKNGDPRRRPETFLRKDALAIIQQFTKLLAIDRSFREKSRGVDLSKGRTPVDKIGRLRLGTKRSRRAG